MSKNIEMGLLIDVPVYSIDELMIKQGELLSTLKTCAHRAVISFLLGSLLFTVDFFAITHLYFVPASIAYAVLVYALMVRYNACIAMAQLDDASDIEMDYIECFISRFEELNGFIERISKMKRFLVKQEVRVICLWIDTHAHN